MLHGFLLDNHNLKKTCSGLIQVCLVLVIVVLGIASAGLIDKWQLVFFFGLCACFRCGL